MNDRIVAIIPARGGSKGIPGKNIINFCGRPLIAWSIGQAKQSVLIQDVFVSTDDLKIEEVSRRLGAKVIWRPKILATDTASSESALIHALDRIELKQKVDAVVFMQATSPLRERFDIDNAVKLFYRQKADSLFSGSLLDDFCAWKKRGNRLKSFTYDHNNRKRRQKESPLILENGSLYIFTPEILRKIRNRLGGRITAFLMPSWKSFEIDTVMDIEICRFFMEKYIISRDRSGDCNNGKSS